MYNYFKNTNKPFRESSSLQHFFSSTKHKMGGWKMDQDGRIQSWFTSNSQCRSFGIHNRLDINGDSPYIGIQLQPFIKSIEHNFDLIMITEYLLESLILLRHDLCLSFDDIVFISKNIAYKKTAPIPQWVERKILHWQRFDQYLYQHFNQTFWRNVESFGADKMKLEKRLLQQRLRELHVSCVDRLVPLRMLGQEFRDWIPRGIELQGYRIKPHPSNQCYRTALSPMAFAIDIEERQCQDASKMRADNKLKDRPKVPCMWPNHQY